MGYYRKKGQANRNIKQSKGFVCPTCDSLVPRGYEICYNFGDDPTLGSSLGSYGSSGDGGFFTVYILFWLMFIAPTFYLFSAVVEPSENPLNFLLLLPNLLIVYYNTGTLLKRKERKKLGCISGPIRIWILIFSVLTFINTMKYFIKLLN